MILLEGLVVGIVFGFLLRKCFVCRFDTIVGQFLLKDFTVMKVMLTAIIVGSIGVWGMLELGILDKITVKPFNLLGNAVGGTIFGIGMALMGLCPGTCVAALGEGTRHAFWGTLGMVIGAKIYVQYQETIDRLFLSPFAQGEITLSQASGLSPWWFIAGVTVVGLLLFVFIEKIERAK